MGETNQKTTIRTSAIINEGLERLTHLFGYEVASFASQNDWKAWREANQSCFSKATIHGRVEKIKARGAYSAWLGLCPADQVICRSANYRESLVINGFNPRQRVVLDILAVSFFPRHLELRIYAPEYITKFAKELRKRFTNFSGSEYLPNRPDHKNIHIPHEDLASLSLKTNNFDLVIANEVFEHLP